jgi:hypothetical protein
VTVLPLDIDYTSRDFDALKDRLQSDVQSVFPDWTDFNQASHGVVLMEMMCYVGDVLGVYNDNAAREAFLSACVRRISALRHTRRMGYTMGTPSAATVPLQFTLREVAAGDVTFLTGETVRAEAATDPPRVQLLSDVTILAGNLSGTVSAEHSLSHTESFESDDSADQEFDLGQTPFLEVTSITDDLGTGAQVDNFLESSSTDFHFVVLRSEDNRAVIRFGDRTNGRVPSGTVTIDYKTGGGSISIDANSLTVPEFQKYDSLSNPVAFDVTNPSASSGGEDEESIDSARISAPASIRVGNRSVALEDFPINAKRVSGVARALMLTSDQFAGLDENYGQLRIIATGSTTSSGYVLPGTPTQAKLDEVKNYIDSNYPATLSFRYDVIAASYNTIDIVARLWLEEGANEATVDAAIRLALQEFFAVQDPDGVETTTVDFGYNYKDELGAAESLVAWSDLFGAVLNSTGVRRVDEDLFQPFDDVTLLLYEFPQLGTITLTNARTGLPLV